MPSYYFNYTPITLSVAISVGVIVHATFIPLTPMRTSWDYNEAWLTHPSLIVSSLVIGVALSDYEYEYGCRVVIFILYETGKT